MAINEDKQVLSAGRRVELFDFDARDIGGSLYHFVSGYDEQQPLMWRGNTYTPLPIEAKGFELTGKGALPTPSLKISNVKLLVSAIINDIGDPLGAKLTRWVTFEDYLDNGATPDVNEHFFPQVFVIERKKVQNKVFVEFELSAAMDQQGRQLPGRQILRDTCTHTYRRYSTVTQSFDNTKATCPYVGRDGDIRPYFRPDGTETLEPLEDVCGKKLSDCKLRFARDPSQVWRDEQPLPTRAYPSVARTR